MLIAVPSIGCNGKQRKAEKALASALEAFNKGDPDKAIADCTEAIRLKPDYAEAYCNRGPRTIARATLTRRLQTVPRPSDSNPITPRHTATVAPRTSTRATLTRRLKSIPRPFGSTRNLR